MNNYYTLEEIRVRIDDDHCSRHCETCPEGFREFFDYLSQLIDSEVLDDAALGITKQIINKGFDSLTPKQDVVFDKNVLKPYTRKYCKGLNNDYKNCQGGPRWEEMYDVVFEDSFCSFCQHCFDEMENDK
jgi:hypothetical protein